MDAPFLFQPFDMSSLPEQQYEDRLIIRIMQADINKTTGADQTDTTLDNSKMDPTRLSTKGINSITLPAGWTASEQFSPAPGYSFKVDSPQAGDAHIGVYSRGRSLSQEDESALEAVLDSTSNGSKLLYDSAWESNGTLQNDPDRAKAVNEQMKSLAGVLGRMDLGDNQFTNDKARPDPQGANFHIDRAEVQTINGKKVLSIDGHNPGVINGLPAQYFSGIFATQKIEGFGTMTHEVFLQATDKMQFMANKAPYRKALSSIDW